MKDVDLGLIKPIGQKQYQMGSLCVDHQDKPC